MSELRFDPISQQYVVFAPDRMNRPHAFKGISELPSDLPNPFAEGNEFQTPGEVYASRREGSFPDQPGWEVRVIPNLYPAFEPTSVLLGPSHPLYPSVPGVGGHEVLIETRDPRIPFEKLTSEAMVHFFEALQNRFNYWKNQTGIESVYLFKNSGAIAGASLPHSHSQLVALPIIPPRFEKINRYYQDYFQKYNRSYSDVLIEEELKLKSRIVWESESIVAFCPYVSRFPYEVVFFPRESIADFGMNSQKILFELAEAVRTVFAKIEAAARPQFPYNLFLQQLPVRVKNTQWFRWSLEVYPRVGGVAGFETGTGMWMNSVLPEVAAERIRNAL